MALGQRLLSLSRRVVSRCMATGAALPVRQPLPAPPPKDTFFSAKDPSFFLDGMGPCHDYVEMTGPDGKLQTVHWADRPDVFGPIGSDGLPTWVNWTRWPAVTPVRNQNGPDCWAHTAAASIEEGGDPYDAMRYVIKNGGLLTEAKYPYIGGEHTPKQILAPGVKIDDCVYVLDIDEHDLKTLVAQQPVTATVGADPDFEDYKGGVINGPNYTLAEMDRLEIAHSIAIVGYHHLRRQPFWLAKNSWDIDWGELGFGLIARNTRKEGGAFGIAREIAYPIMLNPNGLATIDGEKKRKGGQFKVGKKKVKTKLSALAKAKAAQAMEVDK